MTTKTKPRRARGSRPEGRGLELRSHGGKLFWKVDVIKWWGTKERYVVLRIRRAPR